MLAPEIIMPKKKTEIHHRFFYAKLLLFGEHTVNKGSAGLALPINLFEGFFEKNWMDYVQFIDISDNSDHWNKVINVSNRVSVEVQKFNNARQIHTHNLFKITHRSKVILDYKTLKEDLKEFIDTECPNSDNTHIKINRSTSSGENEKRYLEEKDGDEDDGFHWRVKPKEQSLPNGRKHHFITIVWVK